MNDAPEIYTAAVFGKYPRVQTILRTNPAAVNERDRFGFTPLHGVAGEDQPEMLRLLLDAGADVNACSDLGHTPLHLAGYADAVRSLLAAGAEIDARAEDGSTPLHLAAEEEGGVRVMLALLEGGADVHATNNRNRTPLDIARARQEFEKIDLLEQWGAD